MLKQRRSLLFMGLVVIAVILYSTAAFAGTGSLVGQPGSVDDPVVTKSYVDQMKNEIKQEVLKELGGAQTQTPGAAASLVVEQLKPGESIIGYAGTEFIVRSGKVAAIGSEKGDGLPDVTSGTNIKGGQTVPLNHLILLPRDDGRGLKVVQGESYIMIRGNYTIPGR